MGAQRPIGIIGKLCIGRITGNLLRNHFIGKLKLIGRVVADFVFSLEPGLK